MRLNSRFTCLGVFDLCIFNERADFNVLRAAAKDMQAEKSARTAVPSAICCYLAVALLVLFL